MADWETGLFDCFKSASTFCYGFWCCPCLACTVSQQFGERRCLPLFDILSPAVLAACGIPLCVPPAGLSIRAAMRNRYHIKGSLCNDIAISCFCSWCSWCQMHRQLRKRKKGPRVINKQPAVQPTVQPVMQPVMQSAPVMMIPGNPAPVSYMGQPGVVVVSR